MKTFRLNPFITAMISAGVAGPALAQSSDKASAPAPATSASAAAPGALAGAGADAPIEIQRITVIGQSIGKGETRANSVVNRAAILEQPPGMDPLKLIAQVPGLQVGSGDDVTGSFSMRLSMRGLNKEQIGMSIDGIPNGSTLSNGGTMPDRLLDSANLYHVDVSQSAGEIGTPSNQALGGYIDFVTLDPKDKRGFETELSAGNHGYKREFYKFDTGELIHGLTAYADASHEYVRTWPGDQSGRSLRDHVDIRLLQKFDDGSSVRGTFSYNNMADNDYDALALRAGSKYKAVFQVDPNTDELTDHWTGNPAIDQNNRRTRGIDSVEMFAHIDIKMKLGEDAWLSLKPYQHEQTGNGWFYVPYDQLNVNGQVSTPVASGGKPVATVQECYANQYQRSSTGALIPVSAVTYPTGVSASTLSAAGCPAAAKYAMNPQSAWGKREASRRRGGYETDRKGVLGEVSAMLGEHNEVRVGAWFENIRRAKTREWYDVTDPTVSDAYDEGALYSITQDRHYRSHTDMGYVQDKISLLDDKLHIDLGATYQAFHENYISPVEFNGQRALHVSSGVLPKIGALYELNSRTELFTSASKNFSAIPDSVFEGTSAVDAKNGIKPETSTNVDLGIRYVGKTVAASLQVFNIGYRNRISIQNGDPNGDIFSRDATTTFENQGGITSRGVEATYRQAWSQFEVNANVAYTDAYYTQDTPAEGIFAKDPVLGIARTTAFGELTWRPTGTLRLAGNVKYTGKAAGTYDVVYNTTTGTAAGTTPVIAGGPAVYPREYMPAYALFGLSGAYQLGQALGVARKIELGFNVDNLFNKRYLGGLGQELTTSNPLTSGRYFLGSPRTFFASVRAEI